MRSSDRRFRDSMPLKLKRLDIYVKVMRALQTLSRTSIIHYNRCLRMLRDEDLGSNGS
jgi:hypothetical protein